MTIEWKDEYSTNVKRIDDQHRQLFRIVNELSRMIETGVVDGPKMDQLIVFLGSYTRVHFGYEESCMRKNRCPSAEANKNAHREFLKFYEEIAVEYHRTGGSMELLLRLSDTMEKWLDGHICGIDVKLRDCIHKTGKLKH